nr:hypothetical protein [uncultured Draconibacterium sp.]
MELTLIIITSVVLLSQFLIDFIVESKKRKIQIGITILIFGLLSVWLAFIIQNQEKKKSSELHSKERFEQEARFNKLDSTNAILEIELKIRNADLENIKRQNDSLKINLMRMREKQDQVLVISQFSAQEVNKSRVALENMGYKQISRGISEIDKIRMIELLKINKGSKVGLKIIMGDSEAFQFAKQIQEVFESAGWIVDGITQSVYNNVMKGIIIEVKSEKYPVRVNTIFDSFKILNMVATGNIDKRLDDNDVEILIGTK